MQEKFLIRNTCKQPCIQAFTAPPIDNSLTIVAFQFYFFCAVNRTQPTDWFTAFTQFLYLYQMLAENKFQKLKKKMSFKSERGILRNKLIRK